MDLQKNYLKKNLNFLGDEDDVQIKRLENNEKNNLEQDVMLSVTGISCSNMSTATVICEQLELY